MSQSSAITALQHDLVSSKGTQEGKNTCHLEAIRPQPLPTVSLKEAQDVKNAGFWPQRAEMHMKGMTSASPEFCIFSHIEKHSIP